MTLAKMKDVPEQLRPFAWHGVEFEQSAGNDRLADCPFCGKRLAFSCSTETGKWTCHSSEDRCGRKGNAKTFLHQLWEVCHETTSKARYEELAADRGIPAAVLEERGVCWHSGFKRWLVPTFEADGRVHDIRCWVKKPGGKKRALLSTSGVPGGQGLWGMDRLAKAPKGVTVFVLEGEWDGLAMEYLLAAAGEPNTVVVSVPGARTLKDPWVQAILAKASRVVICGDNDADGELMAKKWWGKLNGKVLLDFLAWPDSLSEKYDVRDFIQRHAGRRPLTIWAKLRALIGPHHPRMPFEGQEDAEVAAGGERPNERKTTGPVPKLGPVYAAFNKWLQMTPDLTMALRLAMAVHVSASWEGDCPLWAFMVGPPASGKSEILMSMDGAPATLYQSSVTREALLSGFAGNRDSSLIPRMIGRCAVFKDWTEILDSHPNEQAKTYSCLRGFYDGRVDRVFGNGQERNYIGTCAMLCGTTNNIYKDSKASLGERFLKFQLPRPPRETRQLIIEQAVYNVTREKEKDIALKDAVRHFLDRERKPLDPREAIPRPMLSRLGQLVELIALLRQSVDWASAGGRDREVNFRDEAEMPTRLAKQLARLAIADLVVRGKKTMDVEAWRLIERVAFNTAHGFNLDVIEGMMSMGGENLEMHDIAVATRMHRTTLERRLETLEVLGIVTSRKFKDRTRGLPGGPKRYVSVATHVRRLWKAVNPMDQHMREAAEARKTINGWEGDDR